MDGSFARMARPEARKPAELLTLACGRLGGGGTAARHQRARHLRIPIRRDMAAGQRVTHPVAADGHLHRALQHRANGLGDQPALMLRRTRRLRQLPKKTQTVEEHGDRWFWG